MPSYNPVAQLRCLDGASPGFHDLLYDILYGEEYNQCLPNLDGGDALWLVGYLDKVRRPVIIACPPLKPP